MSGVILFCDDMSIWAVVTMDVRTASAQQLRRVARRSRKRVREFPLCIVLLWWLSQMSHRSDLSVCGGALRQVAAHARRRKRMPRSSIAAMACDVGDAWSFLHEIDFAQKSSKLVTGSLQHLLGIAVIHPAPGPRCFLIAIFQQKFFLTRDSPSQLLLILPLLTHDKRG